VHDGQGPETPAVANAADAVGAGGTRALELAERLGIAVNTVFEAKSRVLSLMRKEVKRLDGEP
jgi:hypothetical protein